MITYEQLTRGEIEKKSYTYCCKVNKLIRKMVASGRAHELSLPIEGSAGAAIIHAYLHHGVLDRSVLVTPPLVQRYF